MNRPRPTRAQGLTLTEVLVSLAIFTVLAAAVNAALPVTLKLNADARTEQAMTAAARAYVEDTRARWRDSDAFARGDLPPDPPAGNAFTCSGSTQATPATGRAALRTVSLTCTTRAGSIVTFTRDVAHP